MLSACTVDSGNGTSLLGVRVRAEEADRPSAEATAHAARGSPHILRFLAQLTQAVVRRFPVAWEMHSLLPCSMQGPQRSCGRCKCIHITYHIIEILTSPVATAWVRVRLPWRGGDVITTSTCGQPDVRGTGYSDLILGASGLSSARRFFARGRVCGAGGGAGFVIAGAFPLPRVVMDDLGGAREDFDGGGGASSITTRIECISVGAYGIDVTYHQHHHRPPPPPPPAATTSCWAQFRPNSRAGRAT